MDDELFMRKAIALSKAAAEHGNEPFGAVLVKDGEIVFTNENQVHTRHDPTFHGEAGLIREFCGATGITDLRDYTLYSSCEPCFMCSGAMVWVKLGRLVYGASNRDLEHIFDEEGCDCSHIVFEHSGWQPKVTSGVLREDCLAVLNDYFRPLVEQNTVHGRKSRSWAVLYFSCSANRSGSGTSGISSRLTTVSISSSLAQSSAGKRCTMRSMTSAI